MSDRLVDAPVWTRFGAGLRAPWDGLRFLWDRPALWSYVAVPVGLLVVGLGLAAVGTIAWVPGFVEGLWPYPDGSGVLDPVLQFLWTVLELSLGLAVFVVAAVVLWSLSTVLSAPFYDALCERVDAELADREPAALDVAGALADAGWALVHTTASLALWAVAMAAASVVGLVPGIGEIVGPIAAAVVTGTFLASEVLDVPLSRRRLGYADKLRFLGDHLAVAEGIGAAAMVALWVPGLNFVSMPAAVVGATLLCARIERERGAAGEAAGGHGGGLTADS